ELVVIDGEHGALDRRTMSTLVGLARALGMSVFVRVAGHRPADVDGPLDAGADGLFVPHVDSRAIARHVVDICRLPPWGRRGGSPTTRAGGWGDRGRGALLRRDAEITLVAQVETPEAVADIDGIVDVPGLDAVFVGAFDLALSSGLAPTQPAFRRMVQTVEDAAHGRVRLGGGAASAAEVADLVARGYSLVMAGTDVTALASGVRSLIEEPSG
ncbi:MAG: HpcH/HpaI aldolase family protein, partial [Phycicoccus sp.]